MTPAADIPGGGWIKLHRKAKYGGWLKNHKLWAFWSYCMLSASHKPCTIIVGCQRVHLEPGQFVFGRRKAAEELGLTEQEVRTFKAFLQKDGSLTSKATNKYSIITLVNWGLHQSESDESTNKSAPQQPAANHKQEIKKVKKENPPFSELIEKYAGAEKTLIEQTLQAVAETRTGGKIAETVKTGILQQFEKHDRQQVLSGCRTYLEKEYHRQGKKETYLLGIIRNQQIAEPAPPAAPSAAPSAAPQTDFDRAFERFRRNQQTAGGAQ